MADGDKLMGSRYGIGGVGALLVGGHGSCAGGGQNTGEESKGTQEAGPQQEAGPCEARHIFNE